MLEVFKAIHLDKDSGTPLYSQLYEKLKRLIEDGTLVSNYKLPSIRQLAASLSVNQVTVVSAYRLLETNNYAYSKPGSGTYVSSFLSFSHGRETADENAMLDEFYQRDDMPLVNNSQIKIDENTINFASATPTPDLFPVENFKTALNDVLERDKGNAFGYQESQGYYPLREGISDILRDSISGCSAENLQIISGAQQGIDIISKAFLRQGDYVVTESPTYTGAIAVFKSRGAMIAGLPMDENGPGMGALEYNLQKYKPRLIYTIPSFQNPTGYSWPNDKRLELLRLAEKYDTYIIEDDYVSDLDFSGKCYSRLKALDTYNRVIFIKSFSKIFMPGLRLGFMIVPPSIRKNILEAKHATDISTSGLIQRAFDLYIRNGFWNSHFSFMYEIYRERYFTLIKALEDRLPPGISFFRPGGGLNIWLSLPYGFPMGSLLKQSSADSVVFAPGSIFFSTNTSEGFNNLRLSFAAVYNHQIERGIDVLSGAIASLSGRHDNVTSMPIL